MTTLEVFLPPLRPGPRQFGWIHDTHFIPFCSFVGQVFKFSFFAIFSINPDSHSENIVRLCVRSVNFDRVGNCRKKQLGYQRIMQWNKTSSTCISSRIIHICMALQVFNSMSPQVRSHECAQVTRESWTQKLNKRSEIPYLHVTCIVLFII